MLDFMMIWDAAGCSGVKAAENRIRHEVARLRLAPTVTFRAWYSRDGHVAVLVWGSDVPPIAPADRIHRDVDGLRFFIGWMMNRQGTAPVASVEDAELVPSATPVGEYIALRAVPEGEVQIWRNAMSSVPLYYSAERHRFVASTRASIASFGRTLSTRFELDPDFARSVLTASVSMTEASLFQGVRSVPMGATIFRPRGGRPVVHVSSRAPLYDEDMSRAYRRDRKRYWDDVYDELMQLMPALDAGDLPIVLPLSGGKDSRLLLALLEGSGRDKRIDTVITWATAGSPEIRSAAAVAQTLGLSHAHQVAAGDGTTPADLGRGDKFLWHTFVTEGEMSPMDLIDMNGARGGRVNLHGQEGGLRNIAGKRWFETSDELLHWFRVYLANWDVCGFLTEDARQQNETDFLDYFGRQLLVVDDLNQLPLKHRQEHRIHRWMARTWQVYNAVSYAPYVLATDPVMRATYNAGPRSRSLEEFHFEMMWRADPRLVEIPFAEQQWDPELGGLTSRPVPQPEPFVWDSAVPVLNRRPIHRAMQHSLESVKQLVVGRRPRVLDGVLDYDKLIAFDAEKMKPGHVQPLLHLMNLLCADAVTAFADLDRLTTEFGSLTMPDFDGDGHPYRSSSCP